MENKFKVGDKLQLVRDFVPFKVGDIFEAVDRDNMHDKSVWIEKGQVLCYDDKCPLGKLDVNNQLNCHYFSLAEDSKELVDKALGLEMVESPSHYDLFPGVEAIQVIASSLTVDEYRGYCLGNLLKYRLRCGKKDNVEQELAKADMYKKLFEQYKHLCKDE